MDDVCVLNLLTGNHPDKQKEAVEKLRGNPEKKQKPIRVLEKKRPGAAWAQKWRFTDRARRSLLCQTIIMHVWTQKMPWINVMLGVHKCILMIISSLVLSPYKCEVGKPQYHYHICFCYYWHNKLRRQFVCAVVRVIESNYPMLGKWLCTKRNPSGIHMAISEVRQSWNVGALQINCSRSTTSFERPPQPWIGVDLYLVHIEVDCFTH